MQHVCGHSGNLGNESADRAAALGLLALPNHNVATRWIHHNFDASERFDGCNNIAEILERLQQDGSQCCVHHRVRRVPCAPHAHFLVLFVFLLSAFFFPIGSLFPWASDGQPFLHLSLRLFRTQHVESSVGVAIPRAG